MVLATVAVVIVNYNAGDYLTKCLEALNLQTRMPNRIILVDNASTDGSLDGLEQRFHRVEFIRLDYNSGFAAANNLAIQRVDDCEWVALLNPDAFAEPEWLENLVRAAERYPDEQFFGSKMLCYGNPSQIDGTGDVYHASGLAWRRGHGQRDTESPEETPLFSPCAAAALYKRQVVLDAGGFDEDYFCYQEDVDLGFRLTLLGYKGRYIPDAVVEHVGWGTTKTRSDFSIYYGHRNLIWTFVKNTPRPLLRDFLPQLLLWNLVTTFWFVFSGHPIAIFKARWDALIGLPRAFKKRRRLQNRMALSTEEVREIINTEWLAPYRQFKSIRKQSRHRSTS